MKTLIIALLFTLLSSSANAEYLTCKEKQEEVESQISVAEKHGNKNRVKGLNRALQEIKDNCTDEGLKKKREEKIKDEKNDVIEAQNELDNAIKSSKSSKKIEKKKRKLEKKQRELEELL